MEELQIQPSKALGQNFLIDGNIARLIVDQANISTGDIVLEIGPGLGALTTLLVERAGRLVTVERDRRLAAFLCQRFDGVKKLRVIEADAMKTDFNKLGLQNLQYTLVANLPYSIGTKLLLGLVEHGPRPKKIVVTVQREVAERLTAVPGTKDYGAASVVAQLLYSARIAHFITPRCFWPPPKVESAVVTMEWFPLPRLKLAQVATVIRLAHAGFAQRRKMLRRLVPEKTLIASGVSPLARAEEVSVEQWIALGK